MAGRDGRGPLGEGPLTGRGLGVCNAGNVARGGAGVGRGAGMRGGFGMGRGVGMRNRVGRGCGFGQGFGFGADVGYYPVDAKTEEEYLKQEKEILEDRLNQISEQLEDK